MARMPESLSFLPSRRWSWWPWALSALLLTGCSTLDVPRADNYPATGQKKARAVHHWDVLAEDVAARIAARLIEWPPGQHPIYISVPDHSSFNQGFVKLLRVRLLDRGVALSTMPTDVELEVQTQVVQHVAQGHLNPPIVTPWTLLATGVGVWRDWTENYPGETLLPGVASAIGVGAGLALDVATMHTQGRATGGPTRTEVLVTTALKSGTRYLTGSADMYYIERDDALLYQAPIPLPQPTVVPPPVGKTWRVVTP